MPESEDFEFEGSSNEQSPFSEDDWFTVHPYGKENKRQPVFAENGESKADAIQRRFGKTKNTNNQNVANSKNDKPQSQTHKNITSFESNNRKLKYEKGAIFDENGNTVLEFDGQEHGIIVSDEDMQKLNGKIFTHNHPNGRTFSKDDLVTGFLNGKLKELRATTPQGVTYSLKPNENNTDGLTKKMVAEFQQVSMRAVRQYKEKSTREIKMGLLSLDDYNKNPYNNFQPYFKN